MDNQIVVDKLPVNKSFLLLEWHQLNGDNGYNTRCKYELCLFSPYDVRLSDEIHTSVDHNYFVTFELGGTKSSDVFDNFLQDNGNIYTPFKDTCHIKYDSIKLGLPMYINLMDNIRRLHLSSKYLQSLSQQIINNASLPLQELSNG